jgi:quercetin dioxygenase-like cupin family protein
MDDTGLRKRRRAVTAMRDLRDLPPRQIWDGVSARLVEGDGLTLAVVEVSPGRRVPEHAHPNEQLGFVIQGSVTFTIGDETRTLGPGGTWQIPASVPHHVDVGPDGAIVAEAYAPARDDWARLELPDPMAPRWPR